jgi:hypothetical protein
MPDKTTPDQTLTDGAEPTSVSTFPAWLLAITIGFIITAFVYWTTADRLTMSTDEGIFLSSGLAVLNGGVPYRDFFVITGPGMFWILAAIFHLTGVTLRHAHLLISLDFGVIIGITYWLGAMLTRRRVALGCAVICAAIFLSSPTNIVDNHRWDSNAVAFASAAAVVYAIRSSSPLAALLAGILGVFAGWITPPGGLIVVPAILRLWLDSKTRRLALFHAAGLALGIGVPAAVLNAQGALVPMLTGLLWNPSHYYGANRVPYGFVFGGPAELFAGVHGFGWLERIILLMPFLLPATLPPVATLVWLPALRTPRRPEIFLLFAGAAMVGSCYPRCDLAHLLCELPVYLILAAAWLDRHATAFARVAVMLTLLLPAAAMCRENLAAGDVTRIETPVGNVIVARPTSRPFECASRISARAIPCLSFRTSRYFISAPAVTIPPGTSGSSRG